MDNTDDLDKILEQLNGNKQTEQVQPKQQPPPPQSYQVPPQVQPSPYGMQYPPPPPQMQQYPQQQYTQYGQQQMQQPQYYELQPTYPAMAPIPQPVMAPYNQPQQQQKQKQQVYQTPDQAEGVNINSVVLDEDKLYQIYVGGLPPRTSEAELRNAFMMYGEIKQVHPQQDKPFGFVNFKTKQGAMSALVQRDITIRGQKVNLASFHKRLQIILRRIPPKISDEIQFQSCISKFLQSKYKDLFVYSQLQQAKYGYSAQLHFLTKEESIQAFEVLKSDEFTRYCAKELSIVNNMDELVIVSNEEVERRQTSGQQPNQDPTKEVLQFLCLRYVEQQENRGNFQQFAQPMYQQQPYGGYQPQPQPQMYQMPQQMNNVRQQQGSASNISVYLKMMPFGTTADEVKNAMSCFGNVTRINLINDKEAQGMNPCAIVFMDSGVQNALQAGQVIIKQGQNAAKIAPHTKK